MQQFQPPGLVYLVGQIPWNQDVFQCGKFGLQVVVLKYQAGKMQTSSGQHLFTQAPDALPLPMHVARLKGQQTGQEVQQRGFAAARRPQNDPCFALVQGKAKILEKLDLAVAKTQLKNLQYRCVRCYWQTVTHPCKVYLMLADTQVLAKTPLFQGVPPQALEVAREAFVTRSYPAGKQIFEAGDMGAALYIVQSGQVRIYRTYLDGRERMFAYLGPGEVFGEMSLLDDQPRSASAETTVDSVLLVLYQDAYWSLVRKWPEILHNLATILARRLREADLELEVLSFEEARGRVAYALTKLRKQRYGDGVRMKLTHQELAQLSGTSRETVTRVLHALREEELVKVGSGYVEIIDPAGLEEVLFGLR